jgi:hypothetical protein
LEENGRGQIKVPYSRIVAKTSLSVYFHQEVTHAIGTKVTKPEISLNTDFSPARLATHSVT